MAVAYVDYSIFEGEKFDARQYANSLLLSTTDRDELLIDFSSAQNKVKFDLEEVEAVVKNEIELNWEDLLERTELAANCAEDIAALEKELKNSIASYDTMAQKALIPYEEAEPLYDMLLNLASTTTILRSLKRYLVHLARLDAARDIASGTDELVALEKCLRENQALQQLRIVISNYSKVDSKRAQLLRDCTTCIVEYRNIGPAITALQQLNSKELFTVLKRTIDKALGDAGKTFKDGLEVTTAIRRLQNSDNERSAELLVQNLQGAFRQLGQIAHQLQALEDECPPDLVQPILEDLCDASASIKQYFWREMSGRISQITREASRNNQWILRTLRAADTTAIVSQGLQRGTMEFSVVHGSLSRR